jgi:imidazolonepropionase-like amidohydrolase
LIDVHVHLLFDSSDGAGYLNRSSAQGARRPRAAQLLRLGFTSCAIPATWTSTRHDRLRNAIQRGEWARDSSSRRTFSPTGGHADLNELSPDITSSAEGSSSTVRTPRAAVREEITRVRTGSAGADWRCPLSSHRPESPGVYGRRLRAAVDEAHRHGKKVCAHATEPQESTRACAGADSIEHGFLIDDEGIAMMKAAHFSFRRSRSQTSS